MTRSGLPAIALLILALVVTACGDTQPSGSEAATSDEPVASIDIGSSEEPSESAAAASEPPA